MQVKGEGLRRTLHELLWARTALVAEHPGSIIPPLTSDVCGNARILESWFKRCLDHPQLASSAVLKCLTLSPASEFAAAQRDFVADLGTPPPLTIQLSAAFKKGKESFLHITGKEKHSQEEAEDDSSSKIKDTIDNNDDAVSNIRMIKIYEQWIAAQNAILESTLEACQAACIADNDTIKKSKKAVDLVLKNLSSAGTTPLNYDTSNDEINEEKEEDEDIATRNSSSNSEDTFLFLSSVSDASFEGYGPKQVGPALRDMIGYLHAASEAVNCQHAARRKLEAAKENLKKVIASSKARIEYLKKADEHQIAAQQQSSSDTTSGDNGTSPIARAKLALSHFGYKAAGAFNKTAAMVASDDSDVTKAQALLDELQTKFCKINVTLQSEIASLQSDWNQRLHDAFRIYAQAEAERVKASAQLADHLQSSI
eukprot:CAMPEP_0197302824 /NCGR_PEP_ID=MMETSP0890-20130614/51290_1 /TAXON_ID=44058 ORGANISM="Aureoumbra lagunensis, Strain CCMP1510" /NCGR_SAMPLE_ID=MMETSP0890 /ASSEMBLY_ACC=CAM_ASM_000533 /LENGTH=425 /DNA_ID=CAMNT_0042782525 /DNA_START=436 /DNA_END=1713 /DNA_ORIENTATION=-